MRKPRGRPYNRISLKVRPARSVTCSRLCSRKYNNMDDKERELLK